MTTRLKHAEGVSRAPVWRCQRFLNDLTEALTHEGGGGKAYWKRDPESLVFEVKQYRARWLARKLGGKVLHARIGVPLEVFQEKPMADFAYPVDIETRTYEAFDKVMDLLKRNQTRVYGFGNVNVVGRGRDRR